MNSLKVGERSGIINRLFKEEKWREAKVILNGWLNKEPDDHWALTRLASAFYEEENYKKSLELVKKALKLKPRCPLALWDFAGTLSSLSRHEEAILIYKKLLRRGVGDIARGECSQGIPWARGLINDCRYRLGLLYGSMDEFHLAIKYTKAYICAHNRNCPSAYDLREVKKYLRAISEGQYPF